MQRMDSSNGAREVSKEYMDLISYLNQGDYQNILKIFENGVIDLRDNPKMQIIKAFAHVNLNHLEEAKNCCEDLKWISSPGEIREYLQSELDNILKPFQDRKPKEINFQINDVCNSKCVMCNIWKQKDRDDITLTEFSKLISHPFFSEVESVGITGGEPTLRKDLVDFYIALANVLPNLKSSSFITNGFLVDRAIRYYSQINKYYVERNLYFTGMVSLDGVEGVHDRVRGVPGAFEKSCRTLFGLMHRGVPVIGCCTIIKENVYDLFNLLSWGKNNGIYIRFRVGEFINRLYNLDRVDQIRNFNPKEIQHLISFFYYLIQNYEPDPQIIKTYQSNIALLSGGHRIIQCPYQTNHSINITSKGLFSFCAPKGRVHQPGSDPDISIKNNLDERFAIQLMDCPDCIHDYHSIYIPQRELEEKFIEQVKREIFSIPPENLANCEMEAKEIPWDKLNSILLVGWYGTETAGDIAILAGIMQEYMSKNPDIQFKLLSLYPDYTKHSLISLPQYLLSRLEISNFWGKDVFRYIAMCDAITMAGGPLMDIPYTYEISCLFKSFYDLNKPCIVEGCGIGPLHNPQCIQNVINIIKMASAVSVRDSDSKEALFQYGITKKITVRSDPSATYIESCHLPELSVEKVIRCYLRELTSEYQQNVTPGEAENRVAAFLQSIIDWFPDYKIELWPMHYFPIGNDDRQYNFRIASKICDSRIRVINEPKSPEEILSSMKLSSYCVCMRFHSVVFASSVKSKFLAIDYTNGGKISGFLKDTQQESRKVSFEDLSSLTKADFLAKTDNLFFQKPFTPKKVLQVSTYDSSGAGNAALRLNDALNLLGNYSSNLLVRYKTSKTTTINKILVDEEAGFKTDLLTKVFQNSGLDQNRSELSNTLFSLPVFGFNLIHEPLVQEADVINLHWISFFQSPESLKVLIPIK